MKCSEQTRQGFDRLVAQSRANEVERLRETLSAEPRAEHLLESVGGLPAPTLRAMVGLLGTEHAHALTRTLGQQNGWQSHTREALELLAAAPPEALAELGPEFFRRADPARRSPEERRLLLEIIERMPRANALELLASKAGPELRKVLEGPIARPLGEAALERARVGEERLLRVLSLGEERLASAGLDHEVDRLGRAFKFSAEPESSAAQLLDWFAKLLPDHDLIRAAGRRLEAEGVLDPLLDRGKTPLLRGRDERWTEVYGALLECRSPEKNARLVSSILASDGFRQRTDRHRALLAYQLLQALPSSVAARFRESDHGRALARLERALDPNFVCSTEYGGLEAEAPENRKRLESPEGRALLEFARDLAARGLDTARSRELVERLGAVEDPELLRAVVRRLDSVRVLETALKKLGYRTLFQDDLRQSSLRLLSARDPEKIKDHARRLLSAGLLDWAITNGEAFFAVHLLKSLPSDERKSFLQERGGRWWNRIQKKLTQNLRELPTANFYRGGENGGDHAAIRAQLLDPGIWAAGSEGRLSTLIRMAKAAGDGEWVFEKSKAHGLHETNPDLCQREQLFHPKDRQVYTPPSIEAENALAAGPLGVVSRFTFQIIASILRAGTGGHLAEYVGLTGLNARELLNTFPHGRPPGVRFMREKEVRAAGGRPKDQDIEIKLDPSSGLIEINAPEIRIARVGEFLGQNKLDTGEWVLKGLKVRAHYPTWINKKEPYLSVEVASAELEDPLLIGNDSMWGARKMKLEKLSFTQATPGVSAEEMQDSLLNLAAPVPILGTVVGAVARIGVLLLGGLDLRGVGELRRPEGPLAQEIKLENFEVTGLSASDGTAAENLAMRALSITGGPHRSAYLRAAGAPMDEIEFAALEAAERRAEQLRQKLADKKTLSPDERKELEALQQEHGEGGYVLKLDSIELDGVRAQAEADHVRLSGISGKLHGPGLGISRLTDRDFLARVHDKALDAHLSRPLTGGLTVAEAAVEGFRVQEPIVLDAETGSDEVRADRARLRALEGRGLTRLSPAEEAEYVALGQKLKPPPALRTETVHVAGTGVEGDVANGPIMVGFGKLDATGFRSAVADLKRLEVSELRGKIAPQEVVIRAGSGQVDGLEARLGVSLATAHAELKNLEVVLKGRPLHEALEVAHVGAESLGLSGFLLVSEDKKDPKAPKKPAAEPAETDDAPALLEPLSGLDGVAELHVNLNRSDPESGVRAAFPVVEGQVDPSRTRASIYYPPNGPLGLIKNWYGQAATALIRHLTQLHVDERGLSLGIAGRLFDPKLVGSDVIGGLHPERGRNGKIDLRELVEEILAPKPKEETKPADAGEKKKPSPPRLRIASEGLALGAGQLKVANLEVELPREAGTVRGVAQIGEHYQVGAESLDLSRFGLELDEGTLRTGASELSKLEFSFVDVNGPVSRLEVSLAGAQIADAKYVVERN